MDVSAVSLPFRVRGLNSRVDVSVWRSTDPAAIGCPEWERDFPVCEATVTSDARGYAALMGWIQVVRMGSPASGETRWVTDPLQIYDDLNTPFGFYGLNPTLFDAPSRRDRTEPLDWHAESYLCFAPSDPMAREALPVAAFSWGFQLVDGTVSLDQPMAIEPSSLAVHVPLLESSYPGWRFLDA